MKQLLYTLLTLLAALQPAMAQEDNTHVTVNVDGTPLESLLTEEQKAQVTHLTITGTLAEDDYAVLRSMLTNQLEEINLRDADIDTIPANAFSHEPVNDYEAKNIVLPTALKHISANAFPKPGNLSAESVYIWLSGGFPTLGETAIGRHCSVRLTEDNEECKAQGEFIMSTDGETLYYLQADYDFLKIQIPVGTKSIWANVFENVSAVRFIMPETVETIPFRYECMVGRGEGMNATAYFRALQKKYEEGRDESQPWNWRPSDEYVTMLQEISDYIYHSGTTDQHLLKNGVDAMSVCLNSGKGVKPSDFEKAGVLRIRYAEAYRKGGVGWIKSGLEQFI